MSKKKSGPKGKKSKAVDHVEEQLDQVEVAEATDRPESSVEFAMQEESFVEDAFEAAETEVELDEDALEVSEDEVDIPAEAPLDPASLEAALENIAAQGEADIVPDLELEGSELESFESASIEDLEFVEEERLDSIIESMLFASDRAISLATFKMTFKGTNVRTEHIRRSLDRLAVEYAGGRRGVSLDEVPGGFQIRTKLDNMKFLTRTLKVRPFKLSGPALEVLAIVAYKQPLIKSEIDEIRGVESGHLLRAIMEKGLVQFEGKSDFPGRPMLYGTTKKFLEIFALRNLKELPTLSQIDELLPEGIGDENDQEKSKLGDLTDKLSKETVSTYSEGEEELQKITETLSDIDVSSEFFEKEKIRQKEVRDAEKAQGLRDAVVMGETLATRDRNWLEKYDLALANGTTLAAQEAAKQAASKQAMIEKAKAAKAERLARGEEESEAEPQESDIREDIQALAADSAAESETESVSDTDADSVSVRFEEEEDISLDQDLNVPYHDEEDEPAQPKSE